MNLTKSGMISIVGRPNVGKSTLTNALVGEKIAIVTNKPQTTRNRICAVLNRGECQYVFMDTPGLHKARTRLGEYMVGVVKESVADVDAVMLLIEPIPHVGGPEAELIARIRALGVPVVLVINKIDTVKKEELLTVMQVYQAECDFQAIVPISAKNGDGVEELLNVLAAFLPEGPQLFPDDMITDQPERQVCAEIIREKLLLCLDKEIPHGTAVELSKFSERENGIIDIDATIYCEKASHKGIIIGKNGAMLKKISTLARKDIEAFMGAKVFWRHGSRSRKTGATISILSAMWGIGTSKARIRKGADRTGYGGRAGDRHQNKSENLPLITERETGNLMEKGACQNELRSTLGALPRHRSAGGLRALPPAQGGGRARDQNRLNPRCRLIVRRGLRPDRCSTKGAYAPIHKG